MDNISVVLKQSLNSKDYESIKQLEDACLENSRVHLKLELDFKFRLFAFRNKSTILSLHETNEFMYYSNGQLVGYLGLFNLGGKTGELAGLVHPLYRRMGIFTKLYQLALDECNKRSLSKVLLVCDNHSTSGQAFIRYINAKHSFSEYLMARSIYPYPGQDAYHNTNSLLGHSLSNKFDEEALRRQACITLRKAADSDVVTIAKMNRECFGVAGFIGMMPEEEEKIDRIMYIIELDGFQPIGKIRIERYGDSSIISGFCILPSYRGMGYGKQAILAAVNELSLKGTHNVSLYVETFNQRAIQVYLYNGFEIVTVIDYYRAG